jgi:CheY-like chemotaxis protein
VRLLLVEDHADTARVMSRLLRSWSYDVSTAGSVADALQSAASEHFDLVISDIGLPDGTGIDLMNDLRARYNLRGIALTGHGMEDDIRRCHEAGFLTHLTKPVNIDALRGVIQQFLT